MRSAAAPGRRRAPAVTAPVSTVPREQWTMPPLALLSRPPMSLGRKVAMGGMWGYLVVAVGLLVVKAVQLAGG